MNDVSIWLDVFQIVLTLYATPTGFFYSSINKDWVAPNQISCNLARHGSPDGVTHHKKAPIALKSESRRPRLSAVHFASVSGEEHFPTRVDIKLLKEVPCFFSTNWRSAEYLTMYILFNYWVFFLPPSHEANLWWWCFFLQAMRTLFINYSF